MTNRIPLIVNPGAAQIQEISSADTLAVPGNLTANVVQTDNLQYANGQPYVVYSDANVVALLNNFGSNNIATTGTITASHMVTNTIGSDDSTFVEIQDGLDVQGDITAESLNVVGTIFSADILPQANSTYSLGNSNLYWSNLWVANNTIYIGGVPIGIGAGNVLTVDGNAVLQNDSNTTISTTGNITADYFFGNGSQLTGLNTSSISNGNSNVDIPVANGNITVTTSGTNTWTFDTTGNLTLPNGGNINEFSGQTARFQALNEDGQSQAALVLNSNYGLVRLESFDNQTSNGYNTADWATGEYVNNSGSGEIVFTDAPTIISFFSTVNNSRIFYQVNGGNLLPSAGYGSGGNNITFYTDIPPVSSPETVTNFVIYYSNRSVIDMDYDEGEMNLLSRGLDINIESDQSIDITTNQIIRLQNYGNSNGITVTTDAGNAFHTWNFQPTGNLNLPSEGNIVGATPNNLGHLQWVGNSSGDGFGYTTLRLVPDDTVEASDQYLIIDPTAPGHIHIRAGGTQDSSGADLIFGGENSHVKVTGGTNPPVYVLANNQSWMFGVDGVFQAPGDISSAGNVLAGNVSVTGNITGNYIIGNGSQLTGLPASYTDANVTTLLSNLGSNTISGTGNITTTANISGEYILGNAAFMTGIPASYGNADVATFLAAYGSNTISTTGNISAGYLFGNGSQITGLPATYGNADVATLLAAYGSNNISTTGNITAGNISGNISITGNITGTTANVDLVAGVYIWTFNNAGNLVLPGNTFAVNYANGTQVSLGGAGSYGDSNVVTLLGTFGSNTISTTGTVTAGNITGGNLLTGGSISATGNVTANNIGNIAAINLNGNSSQVLYGNGVFAAAAGGGTYGDSNVATLLGAFGSNTVSTTGTVTTGTLIGTNNLVVNAPSPTAEGGQLILAWANISGLTGQGNSTWNLDVDGSSNVRLFYQNATSATGVLLQGNVTGNSISFPGSGGISVTGNATVDGTGSNLTRRASFIGAANTAVTLDNFEARLGGSPVRLYINTVSGNATLTGTSQTYYSGGVNASQWVNVPVGAGAANAFAMSGAVSPSTGGEMVMLNFCDQISGTFMYRVTAIVANTTSGNNAVTIERLA